MDFSSEKNVLIDKDHEKVVTDRGWEHADREGWRASIWERCRDMEAEWARS